MSRIRNIVPLVLALLALVALPAATVASSHPNRDRIIKDCVDDGKIDGHYKKGDLKDAYDHVPTDVNEYTDCRAAIARAMAALKTGGGGAGGGGGPAGGPPVNPALTTPSGAQAGSPADLRALKAASGSRTPPDVSVGGHVVSPATGGLSRVADSANSLPTPLLAALLAVILLCLGASFAAIWRRWPELRRAPLGLLRR